MFCIMFCVFIVSFHQIVKAKSVVFSNWYSDEDWVGYWGSAPKVFFTNLNDSYNVSLDVNTAVNKWTSAGISSSVTVTPTNASIKYYGGTKAQLNGIGFTYTSEAVGLTMWDSYTTAADANLGYSVKKLYAVSASTSTSTKAANRTNVTMHEYGHALGWYGHILNDDRANVMYREEQSRTTLSSKDKKQLTQAYNAMKWGDFYEKI